MDKNDFDQKQAMEQGWLTIPEASRLIPGRPSHPTVARWALRGVRGKVLSSTVVAGGG